MDEASKSQANVAKDADVEATYETKGYPATNAVECFLQCFAEHFIDNAAVKTNGHALFCIGRQVFLYRRNEIGRAHV